MANWTDAQREAIYAPSGEGSILVSAAAGSGKTAVLVERIAAMITRGSDPVSIDRLLVVTFTEAAASEMKERIISRLTKSQREANDAGDTKKSRYIKEQIYLTALADINTIDAFCLGVVKNNFHILGIDPNFGIMDEHEGALLMDDTMTELFSQLYASEDKEENERFIRLVSTYASNRDDEGLKSVIRKVYRFIQSFAEPEAWLDDKADMYSADMASSRWIRDIVLKGAKERIIKRHGKFWEDLYGEMLTEVNKHYKTAYTVTDTPADIKEGGAYWGKVWDNVCVCREAVRALEAASSADEICDFCNVYISKKSTLGNAINKIPAKKEASDELWQGAYDRYNAMRDDLRECCGHFPAYSGESFNSFVHAAELKQSVDDIVWLTKLFGRAFEEKKNSRGEKSFADIERLTYLLFRENENIRDEYSQKYEEILIDEYQDTNGLQDSIFRSISRDDKNIFMVGDLKQSIYRFRGGDPTIFKEKNAAYADGRRGKRIVLSQNFRSRREVLRSVNSFFKTVMSDEVGDVEYNDDEALHRDEDRECYEDGENLLHPCNRRVGYESELHRISVLQGSDENDDDLTVDTAEASYAADKIRALIDGKFQIRGKDGAYRDIEYRDIVILMRSTRTGSEIVRRVFSERSIPVFVQKEEYFSRREIKLMLTLISLINNNIQDIPLISVMRSPIGGFSEDELAKIRLGRRGTSFYAALKGYNGDDKLGTKCRAFLGNLSRWRGYVKMKSIASLIWTLYEETGFYDFMGALEGGEESQANLKLLYERAKKYEASGFKGIFNFIRYIERMESASEDISGAQLINENHNVVRVMTIHKSKGLEFPVVLLMKTNSKMIFRRKNEETRILLHKDMGIGLDYFNYENMYSKKLPFNGYINDESVKETKSEELRLLYVAMTRAKEKLIVLSSKAYAGREKVDEQTEKWRAMADRYRILSAAPARDAATYSDWLIPAVMLSGEGWSYFDEVVTTVGAPENTEPEKRETTLSDPQKLRDAVRRILEFKYAYPDSGAIPAKTSVTAIKEMHNEQDDENDNTVYMTQKPAFMRSEKSGAEIGTAHHQVMANINIEEMRKTDGKAYGEFVKSEIARIAREGQLDADIASDTKVTELICENVCAFFESDMGRRVFSAKRVCREKPFEIEISAREYDSSVSDSCAEDKIVVQGIIDLYFEDENGNLVLVDYKTDRCKTQREQLAVASRYEKQIELYGQAMEKILKKSVKEKYLYLFSARSVVKLM